jgi:hypothetical protein
LNDDQRDTEGPVRALLCIGLGAHFFDAEPAVQQQLFEGIPKAFADLETRFGVKVLGSLDDDQLMVGVSQGWPWTAYVLADAPSHKAVAAVCNIIRETEVAGSKLWKFMRIEARVGRPLFFIDG